MASLRFRISGPAEGEQARIPVVEEPTDPALRVDLPAVHPVNENARLHKVVNRVAVQTQLTAQLSCAEPGGRGGVGRHGQWW
ncbi:MULTISPECIES: hypothetical protein [unclassified Synechococcus]|uniref:hypothetical protein n=1 Tax=unclassified Synechococcus TaxID=2626047 RepID=UPI0039B0E246